MRQITTGHPVTVRVKLLGQGEGLTSLVERVGHAPQTGSGATDRDPPPHVGATPGQLRVQRPRGLIHVRRILPGRHERQQPSGA